MACRFFEEEQRDEIPLFLSSYYEMHDIPSSSCQSSGMRTLAA